MVGTYGWRERTGGQRGRPSELSRPGLVRGGAHLKTWGVLLSGRGEPVPTRHLGVGAVAEGTICTTDLND